jgi:hypothetical protein
VSVEVLPVGILLSVKESLRALSESAVADGAEQCVVVLMRQGVARPAGDFLDIRGFGPGNDGDRTHMLLALAQRQIEDWFKGAL